MGRVRVRFIVVIADSLDARIGVAGHSEPATRSTDRRRVASDEELIQKRKTMTDFLRQTRDHGYQLRLTMAEHAALLADARARDMTAADLLRKALDDYLKANPLPQRRRHRRA